MSKLISIGKVLNFHGIKGEIKLGFTAGKENLIKSLKKVYLFVDNNKVEFSVSSVRFHKNFAIVKFGGINSIDDVMKIKGLLVHVPEEFLKSKLQKDEFLISDLVGLEVFDTNGEKIGKVNDIGENKASNLIEIEKLNGLKFMVPFVKEWVPEVDLDGKKIVVNMIEGIDSSASDTGVEK